MYSGRCTAYLPWASDRWGQGQSPENLNLDSETLVSSLGSTAYTGVYTQMLLSVPRPVTSPSDPDFLICKRETFQLWGDLGIRVHG